MREDETVMIKKCIDRAPSIKTLYVGWMIWDLVFIVYDAFCMGYSFKEGNHPCLTIFFMVNVIIMIGCLVGTMMNFWRRLLLDSGVDACHQRQDHQDGPASHDSMIDGSFRIS